MIRPAGWATHSCRLTMPNRPGTCGSESRPCDQTTRRSRRKSFWPNSGREAGIVEERIEGEEFHSPSVQLRASPLKDVEVLSTHDQILGGATGQEFLGCRFPAHRDYGWLIAGLGERIGSRLAQQGVIGRFGVDFVVVRRNGEWLPYAIEVNLRNGGTTHPMLTLGSAHRWRIRPALLPLSGRRRRPLLRGHRSPRGSGLRQPHTRRRARPGRRSPPLLE